MAVASPPEGYYGQGPPLGDPCPPPAVLAVDYGCVPCSPPSSATMLFSVDASCCSCVPSCPSTFGLSALVIPQSRSPSKPPPCCAVMSSTIGWFICAPPPSVTFNPSRLRLIGPSTRCSTVQSAAVCAPSLPVSVAGIITLARLTWRPLSLPVSVPTDQTLPFFTTKR